MEDPDAGPFDEEKDFNDALVRSFEQIPNYHGAIIRSMLKEEHTFLFSHGDMRTGNILIRNGQLAAVIDWEFAGFYPEYSIASVDIL